MDPKELFVQAWSSRDSHLDKSAIGAPQRRQRTASSGCSEGPRQALTSLWHCSAGNVFHYALIVDGQVKTEFKTQDQALKAARELKGRFPMLQVKIYDAESKRSEDMELTAA